MVEYGGYRGRSVDFLKRNGIRVGDPVRILSGGTFSGIIMPRYEHGDDRHLVLKLHSGYNVGLDIAKISDIERTPESRQPVRPEEPAPGAVGLPRILLLSTGGTIASRVDYRTGAVTPTLTAGDLRRLAPEISDLASIDIEILFSEYSENIMPEHWLRLAERIDRCRDSDYAGIIVAHGTDTMHYTSSFLSFALNGFPVPIALIGSQRSPDRASSDAALNLIGAVRLITEEKTAGVYVVMHQDESDDAVACHVGTRVRKSHTSRRGAFQTIDGRPAFVISDDGIQRNVRKGFFAHPEYSPRIGLDSRVALVKYHPGYDPGIIEHMIDSGCRGIIFEGTGLGHIGDSMYKVVRKAASNGVFLGMTSQCISGRIRMTVYESGRDLLDLGIVPLDMIPETALVKAMWVIGNFGAGEVRSRMLECVASETAE